MPPRTPLVEEHPEGLVYQPDLLTAEEEDEVLGVVEAIDFREVVMRGQVARRTVRHFGYDYDYESWDLVEAEPLPDGLLVVRERSAALAGVEPDELEQALVTRYPPGAGIGSHRDAPIFGPDVVGVSLRAPSVMRFRRSVGGVRYGFDQALEPRSAYVLGGKARSAWKHEIPPTKDLRYSITFRTVRSRTLRRPGSA
jgi:alkylated DNA repair protein (DNA oxidative demethylase)